MSTTVEMWAVFDPEGDLIVWTTRTQIYNSQESFLKNAFWPFGGHIHSIDWPKYEKQGYTCRPVRVTIEELPQGQIKEDDRRNERPLQWIQQPGGA